jgi:outer membrane protein OmpA-like peptidoglycan-associated protein
MAAVCATALTWSAGVLADERVRGIVTGRGDDGTVAVRTDDSSDLLVALTELTTITRTDGFRELRMSAAELIPGLRVQLDGQYEAGNRFVAHTITFSRADLKTALAIRGGVDATDRRSIDNRQRIEHHAQILEQQRQTLERQQAQLAANHEQIRANEEKIVGTTGALAETNARIANLRDFNVISSMTVRFGNKSASIPRKYKTELQQLAVQARNVDGYLIQVQGFASAVGPEALNQRLSMERAEAVAAVLSQHGIPPTHMLVPAAMGTSEQVDSNKTAAGQAQNRRAVVTLLQNKGLSQR